MWFISVWFWLYIYAVYCCVSMRLLLVFQLRSKEYEEALNLAREYDLDTDMVYQRQWQSYQVSSSTIQDYLVSSLLTVWKVVSVVKQLKVINAVEQGSQILKVWSDDGRNEN